MCWCAATRTPHHEHRLHRAILVFPRLRVGRPHGGPGAGPWLCRHRGRRRPRPDAGGGIAIGSAPPGAGWWSRISTARATSTAPSARSECSTLFATRRTPTVPIPSSSSTRTCGSVRSTGCPKPGNRVPCSPARASSWGPMPCARTPFRPCGAACLKPNGVAASPEAFAIGTNLKRQGAVVHPTQHRLAEWTPELDVPAHDIVLMARWPRWAREEGMRRLTAAPTGVKLYVDLETLQLIEGPGFRNPVTSLRFKRGDAARLEVAFLTNGTTPATIGDPASLELRFGVKPRNRYDVGYLVHTADWTMPAPGATSPVYQCAPSFNTTELDSALQVGSSTGTELSEITLMGEITWREGAGEPTSTAHLHGRRGKRREPGHRGRADQRRTGLSRASNHRIGHPQGSGERLCRTGFRRQGASHPTCHHRRVHLGFDHHRPGAGQGEFGDGRPQCDQRDGGPHSDRGEAHRAQRVVGMDRHQPGAADGAHLAV